MTTKGYFTVPSQIIGPMDSDFCVLSVLSKLKYASVISKMVKSSRAEVYSSTRISLGVWKGSLSTESSDKVALSRTSQGLTSCVTTFLTTDLIVSYAKLRNIWIKTLCFQSTNTIISSKQWGVLDTASQGLSGLTTLTSFPHVIC